MIHTWDTHTLGRDRVRVGNSTTKCTRHKRDNSTIVTTKPQRLISLMHGFHPTLEQIVIEVEVESSV